MTRVSPLRSRVAVEARRVRNVGMPSTGLVEVGLAHLGRDGEHDVALLGDARDEVHDGPERLELDVGREAGDDPDRDLAADLEDRVLAAQGEQLRLREDRGEPLALQRLDEGRDVILRQLEREHRLVRVVRDRESGRCRSGGTVVALSSGQARRRRP